MTISTRTIFCLAFAILLLPVTVPGGSGQAVAQETPPQIIQTMRWRAWVDAMPGPGRGRFHPIYVSGEVLLRVPAYKTTLVKANPRDVRNPVLVLNLEITRERKPDAPVITRYTPRYVDESPPRRYQSVEIRYNGRVLQRIDRIQTIQ